MVEGGEGGLRGALPGIVEVGGWGEGWLKLVG